jgi:putative peptide zinc metalloprotease protein
MIGRWAPEGRLVGYVVADEPRVIRAVVTQDNIELVRNYLRGVEAKVADRRSETFSASVVREVPAARNELPSKALGASGGGRIAVDPRDNEGGTVLERVFQFDVRLSPTPSDLYYGTRVYLRFSHAWEPLGFQWYRRLRQLFLSHFDV